MRLTCSLVEGLGCPLEVIRSSVLLVFRAKPWSGSFIRLGRSLFDLDREETALNLPQPFLYPLLCVILRLYCWRQFVEREQRRDLARVCSFIMSDPRIRRQAGGTPTLFVSKPCLLIPG